MTNTDSSLKQQTSESKHVVVIGAGVVGLTTAVKIQEHGSYNVTIIAETFPTDPKSIRYTSLWAGAHHVSHAEGEAKQQKIDEDTFKVMWELSAPGGEAEGCFLRLPQTDYFYDGRDTHLDWMPDFKKLSEDSLIQDAQTGISFTTLTIDTPVYLPYLLSRFLSKGGRIVRASVQHINQIVEGGADVFSFSHAGKNIPDAIVACPGLGARTLGGIEDKDVYPTASHAADGLWTYIIPRRSGDVIVGGTKEDNDWFPVARHSTTLEILARGLALCPEIAPPEIRSGRTPTVDDLLPILLEEGCGFRPARKGGIRLGVEWINGGKSKSKIPLVFNYGHGGGGYQSSWGSAEIALDLLSKALEDGPSEN
ncbi:DAMOX/DASOX family protein [Abortiporus biennis]